MSIGTAGVVEVNGVLHAPSEARISVFDRGFLYGDAAFEVMRTYGKRPFCQREHLARLYRSCERLRIAPPCDAQELTRRIARVIEHSGLDECYLRVVITRGAGSMGLEAGDDLVASVVLYALPLKLPPPEVYAKGVSVGLSRVARATDGTAAEGAKTSNYLASVLALAEVRERGHHEALIVGAEGTIVEGSTSNVFAVIDGRLVTPPASAGILEGITRHSVLALARGQGLSCEERPLPTADLLAAQEVFITSSIREVVPVVRVEDRVVGDGRPGAVARGLLAAYRKLAAS